jgi:hypothetical protein
MKLNVFKTVTAYAGMAIFFILFASCEDSESGGIANPWPGDLDIDCTAIPYGPFDGEVFINELGFVEDLAFDGMGNFVVILYGKDIKQVDAEGNLTTTTMDPPATSTSGTRYMPDGRLMAALPSAGEILQISPDGTAESFIDGLIFPNGVYADFTGALWVTDSDRNEVLRVSPEGQGDVVASGEVATGPNGVVYDELRQSLFFATGMYLDLMSIVRIDFDENGVASEPVVVIALDDANGDGVAMDGCGNIYFADNHSPSGTANEDKTTKIRRLRLDGAGDLLDSEIIAEMPGSITNFQWGSGPGFDPESLYTVGFGGVSYQIDVGVLGAPVPVPDFSN